MSSPGFEEIGQNRSLPKIEIGCHERRSKAVWHTYTSAYWALILQWRETRYITACFPFLSSSFFPPPSLYFYLFDLFFLSTLFFIRYLSRMSFRERFRLVYVGCVYIVTTTGFLEGQSVCDDQPINLPIHQSTSLDVCCCRGRQAHLVSGVSRPLLSTPHVK